MLKSQEVQIKLSEIREKINGLPDDASAEELNGLTGEYQRLEAQYRAAVLVEAEEVRQAGAEFGPDDGTSAEVRAMLDRASLSRYLLSAVGQTPARGAEAELRAALLGEEAPETQIPIDVLLRAAPGGAEHRADVHSSVGASYVESQASIAARVFAAGAGAYLGVDRPTVPAGQANFPVLSGGTTADFRDPAVAKDSEAASLTVGSVNPARVTARYTVDMESLYRLTGYEEALAADLTGAIEDRLDVVAIAGQADVANVSPAVEGLISQLTNPENPSTTSVAADFLKAYSESVDGKYAPDEMGVRLLVNPATYGFAQNLLINTEGGGRMLRDVLEAARFRASANMPATPTTGDDTGIATGIVYRSASPRRGFVQPVWRGITMIRDPYTGAASGLIALTAHVLTNCKMIDENVYRRVEFKTN